MVKSSLSHILFVFFVLLAILLGYFYFFHLSPIFVSKPIVEKPAIVESKEISFLHVAFLLNELDAYKLHKDALTGESPLIRVNIEDTGEIFFVQVINGQMKETSGKPDLAISTRKETFFMLLEGDIELNVYNAISSGELKIDMISDEKTLAMKGYKVIYDKLNKNTITGDIIGMLYPIGIIKGIEILFFLLFSLTILMILEKET